MADPVFLSPFNFAVHIELSGLGDDEGLAQGQRRGAFSEVQGLEISVEAVSLREGGYNRGARQLVGKTTNPPLILKRGLSLDAGFWKWVRRCLEGPYPLPYVSGTVRVLQAKGGSGQAGVWHFDNAIVTKIKGADLNAGNAREVPLEELHLVHEGLSRELTS